jgi:hypothetical protein
MKELKAVAAGPWVLSAFAETKELPESLNPLRILVYADTKWTLLADIFQSEEYQLCGSPAGLMLCRQGGDDIILEVCPREDLERAGLPSLEAYAVWEASSTQTACFMTWNQAVCLCPTLTFDSKYILLKRSDGKPDRKGSINEAERLQASGYEAAIDIPAEFSAPRKLGDDFCKVVDVGGQSSDGISCADWTFSFETRRVHAYVIEHHGTAAFL